MGFDTNLVHQSGGMGLQNMKDRMDKLGGSVTITSSPGQGAMLRFQAPLSIAGVSENPKQHITQEAK